MKKEATISLTKSEFTSLEPHFRFAMTLFEILAEEFDRDGANNAAKKTRQFIQMMAKTRAQECSL